MFSQEIKKVRQKVRYFISDDVYSLFRSILLDEILDVPVNLISENKPKDKFTKLFRFSILETNFCLMNAIMTK